jgi:uncharacterized membrane-anchored protein
MRPFHQTAARETDSRDGATARLDKRTKNLVKRLKEGDIAIIDHTDIDRVSAESLIEMRPSIVVNAACSVTGNYPNLGPLMIVASGIPILDEVGAAVFENVTEAELLKVEGDSLTRGAEVVASGRLLTLDDIEQRIEQSKKRLGMHLGDFAANTVELLEAEKEILLESVDLPHISTLFSGRHVLIVVRGHDYKQDLQALKSYIREMKPVLVGVDGGADALIDAGYKPHMIVGDMDSVTDEALRGKAELVVHGYSDGRAPGKERLETMGLRSTIFHYPGTSEDIAMLIAYEKGAEMIAIVGGHTNLIEFLDKDRKGMASTFLVRLRVGSALVDAKGVSQLYQTRVKVWHLGLMALAAMIVIVIVILLSEPARQLISVLAMRFQVWLMHLQKLI